MMSKPSVVLLVQRQRKPLMKMFRPYATMASTGAELASKMTGSRGVQSESYSVTTDQLLELAEEFEICPTLLDVERCRELREKTRPSADYGGLDFSGFCEWLCVVACELYTTGYDDLARNGYEVEYPTVQLRLERLFYEIDKSGVLFDLRGSSVVPRADQTTAASRTAGRENIKENVKNSFSNFTQPPPAPGSSPAQSRSTRAL